MPAIGNIIQATIKGSYLDIPWVTTHYYRCNTASADPLALSWLSEQVHDYASNWAQFAVEAWILNSVDCTNLSNTAEVGEFTQSQYGLIDNSYGRAPSGVNIFFKLVRSSTITRNGIRYWCGIAERDIAGNNYVGNVANMQAFGNWYLQSPSSPTMGTYAPVIVRKRPSPQSPIDNAVRGVVLRGITVMNRRMR